jgi:phage tail tape-measure protein
MGKGGYIGGSTKVYVGSDGTSWDSGDPKAETPDGPARKRWDQESTLDAEGRAAAKAYRKLVSRFLAECAAAFCTDKLTPMFPKPPRQLAQEVANWGGNVNWISKHEQRKYQFAAFVKNQGWTP